MTTLQICLLMYAHLELGIVAVITIAVLAHLCGVAPWKRRDGAVGT